jgi:hypothetical protein
MTDKDMFNICYSYLTLAELKQQNIGKENLMRVFKDQNIVLAKVTLLSAYKDDGQECDEFVSYKLFPENEIQSKIKQFDEAFPPDAGKFIFLDGYACSRSDFCFEINSLSTSQKGLDKILLFFQTYGASSYSSYLGVFEIVNDVISRNDKNLNFSTYEPFYIYNGFQSLDENKKLADEVLVTCYCNFTGESQIMSGKDYCDLSRNYFGAKFGVHISVDTNVENIKVFRELFGENNLLFDGCLTKMTVKIL